MKTLMYTFMDEAGDATGGGGGGGGAGEGAPAVVVEDNKSALDSVSDEGDEKPAVVVQDDASKKTDEDPNKDEKPKGEDGKPKELTPEEFAEQIGLPADDADLKDMKLDPEIIKDVSPIAKELGLTPEQVSKLAVPVVKRMMAQAKEAQEKETAEYKDWYEKEKAAAIKEFGKEGLKTAALAVKAYVKPGSMLAVMIERGLGNDKDFLRLLHKVGEGIRADGGDGLSDGGRVTKGGSWRDGWSAGTQG